MKFIVVLFSIISSFVWSQQTESELFNYALECYNNQKYVSAKLTFNEILKENPNHYESLKYRADCQLLLENYQSAIDDYNRLIDKDTFLIASHLNRGVSKFRLNEFTEALIDFNLVIEKDAFNLTALFERAVVLMSLNEYNKALNDFNSVLKISSDNTKAYEGRSICKGINGDQEGACIDLLLAKSLGSNSASDLLQKRCGITEFPMNIGDCISRDCLSPLVMKYKIAKGSSLNTNLIEGKWEVITSLMTWEDSVTNEIFSTLGRGKYKEDYNIVFEFNKGNKGKMYSNNEPLDIKWDIVKNSELVIKSKDIEEQYLIRIDSNFMELIIPASSENNIYWYEVLKRVEE